jgi:large subunit ribosomal protein L24
MPTPISRLPRKQRKSVFTAHNTQRRRFLTVALSKELRDRYGRRQLPVRKGDTVRVLAGSYEGQEERVAKIHTRSMTLTLDNITLKKADQKLKALAIRPNHLILTRLNLSDGWRRRVLKVTEAEPTSRPTSAREKPTEGDTAPSTDTPKTPRRPSAKGAEPTEKPAPAKPAAAKPSDDDDEEIVDDDEDAPAESAKGSEGSA